MQGWVWLQIPATGIYYLSFTFYCRKGGDGGTERHLMPGNTLKNLLIACPNEALEV